MNGKRPGGWVALSVRYFRDPKFGRVSDAAELMYLRGLAYSGEHETDGELLSNCLWSIRPRARTPLSNLAGELVAAGLWVRTLDGYAVPFDTWSRWQETAKQRQEARARTAERQARWRARHGVTDPVSNALRNATSGAGAGAGAEHSSVPPAPRARPREENQGIEPPARIGWEEYTDAAGNLFVRQATNGQAAEELEP